MWNKGRSDTWLHSCGTLATCVRTSSSSSNNVSFGITSCGCSNCARPNDCHRLWNIRYPTVPAKLLTLQTSRLTVVLLAMVALIANQLRVLFAVKNVAFHSLPRFGRPPSLPRFQFASTAAAATQPDCFVFCTPHNSDANRPDHPILCSQTYIRARGDNAC